MANDLSIRHTTKQVFAGIGIYEEEFGDKILLGVLLEVPFAGISNLPLLLGAL